VLSDRVLVTNVTGAVTSMDIEVGRHRPGSASSAADAPGPPLEPYVNDWPRRNGPMSRRAPRQSSSSSPSSAGFSISASSSSRLGTVASTSMSRRRRITPLASRDRALQSAASVLPASVGFVKSRLGEIGGLLRVEIERVEGKSHGAGGE
jgi:hypothetical protein